MKRFQMKPLVFTTTLLIMVVALRMYQSQQMEKRWNAELTLMVNVEPLDTHEINAHTVSAIDSNLDMVVLKNEEYKPKLVEKTRKNYSKKVKRPYKKNKPKRVNINTEKIADWKQLPGIGDVLSARIIKFKDRLGGFHSVSQLKEVYGLSEETYALNLPYLFNSSSVELLDLKHIEFKRLLRHPYFEYEDVKSVKNYLRKNSIQSMQSLLEASNKDQQWVNKVWPYLNLSKTKDNVLGIAGLSK